MATCFLHLLPELNEHLEKMKVTHNYYWDYPIAELFSCVGFFLLFFFEELVIVLFPSIAHNNSSHSHSHNILSTRAISGSDEE